MQVKFSKFELVSVIIPVYNINKELLVKSIQSIFDQSYPVIEIVLSDDGSEIPISDNLTSVFSLCNNPASVPVKIVREELNKGIAAARNHAIQHAAGKWLVWLDADDTLAFDCIESLISHSPGKDLVIGECLVSKGGNIERRAPGIYYELAKNYFGTPNDPFLLNIISLQPQLFLREVFDTIGKFDESYRYAELTELFLRYIVKRGIGNISFISKALYHYNRDREGTLTSYRSVLFEYRKKALVKYMHEQHIEGSDLIYKQRNPETGMQEYELIK